MKLKSSIIVACLMFFVGSLNAQIAVTNTQTPEQLVQSVLLGFGVTATNVTVNGSAVTAATIQGNATFFDASSTAFPIGTGVLLTTGNGIGAIGPNNSTSDTENTPPTSLVSSDVHLNSIAAATVTNGIVLEFDFIPSGDTLSFQYLFGSEEYPEFAPPSSSSFNDAFGFFLWGPGITGPYALGGYPAGGANIATVPGTTTPVTINNVNAITNPAYYLDNAAGAAFGPAIQYDGSTTVLTANASVQCGQTYHIKLAIANVGDQAYDSGVFLQANSFSSEAVQIAIATVSGDTSIYEGCADADIMFIRPASQVGDTLIVNYTIGGTATEGVDYTSLTNPVTFLPGEDTVTLTVSPIADGFPDNGEYVTLTATTITPCGDTIVSTGTLYVLDSLPMPINEPDPILLCATDDSVQVIVSSTGAFQPYDYDWSTGQTGDMIWIPGINGPNQSIDYIVTATAACGGYTSTDTVTLTLNQSLSIDSLVAIPATSCTAEGEVTAYVSGITQVTFAPVMIWEDSAHFHTPPTGYFQAGSYTWSNVAPGWYYYTIQDEVCEATDSVYVDVLSAPIADFSVAANGGCDPLAVTFINESSGGVTYDWNFGSGTVTVNNMDDQNMVFNTTTTVTLIAYDQYGCPSAPASGLIDVWTCGCTDPEAENYDPNAFQDDGSCFYPDPTVHVPNIFTPNGDNNNDVFLIATKNAVNIEYVIVNRWGNTMYEESIDLTNPLNLGVGWNGLAPSGAQAAEGTYFYTYVVTGIDGEQLEGHGFVQLVRQ